MAEKTALIIGGNLGLGYECAKNIAANPAWHVIITGRNQAKNTEAVEKIKAATKNPNVSAIAMDLASLDSVRQFAAKLAGQNLPPLKALICNAALQVVTGTTYTADGFETTFGVNQLGHFLLANLLLNQLVAPARILFIGSGTHDPALRTGVPEPHYRPASYLAHPEQDPERFQEKPSKEGSRRYSTSKLCNILTTYEMARRLKAAGRNDISVNVFDPGLMPGSGLARDYKPWQQLVWKYIFPIMQVLPGVNSIATSGRNLAKLAIDPQFEGISGKYWAELKEIRSSKESYETAKAAELWEGSVELVKLTPQESALLAVR